MIGSWWVRFRRSAERVYLSASLDARLAFITGLSVVVTVFSVGLIAFLSTRWSLLAQLDEEMMVRARAAATSLAANPDNITVGSSLGASGEWLAVVPADGSGTQVLDDSLPAEAGNHEIAIARTQQGASARTAVHEGRNIRMVAVPFESKDGLFSVALARPMLAVNSTLNSLWVVLLTTGLAGSVMGTLAAAFAARTALSPVRRLSEAVRNVTETDQLHPIRIYGRDDLGQLTLSFNTMLRSLQTSREQQRQLIADAGHELRTPLTSMRTNLELLVADDQSGMLPPGARSEILEDVSAQLGEFSALVGDLVALTRDDHLQREPEPLDLMEVTEAALARARRRGPTITFVTDLEPSMVLGDASTLERAVTNLLDNAVKFTPSMGTVWITLDKGVLTIVDSGPGIAEEDLPYIFDRFFRSDRSRNTPGTGLGLSIVQHTVDAHKGTIRANNHPQHGARFVMRIPLLAEEDEDFA